MIQQEATDGSWVVARSAALKLLAISHDMDESSAHAACRISSHIYKERNEQRRLALCSELI